MCLCSVPFLYVPKGSLYTKGMLCYSLLNLICIYLLKMFYDLHENTPEGAVSAQQLCLMNFKNNQKKKKPISAASVMGFIQ